MKLPDFSYEEKLWRDGFAVIGIDEVGRGAFAGSLAVGGVVFEPRLKSSKKEQLLSLGINDSKKLTPKKRESLAAIIKKECLAYSISFIDVSTINEIGIGKATFLGMREVVEKLKFKVQSRSNRDQSLELIKEEKLFALIDAFEIPSLDIKQRGIIHGDSLSISIASASIVAKVTRDKYMEELSKGFKVYGWEDNKGYGTKLHREAIKRFGQTEHHRSAFCSKFLVT